MVGLGVASTQILPAISKLPFIEITAAADTRADALAKFRQQYKAEGHASVADLCASPNVDAVYIATPNSLHAEHAITAAEHNKHIIVEKPMAMTLAECDAMNEAAEKHGVKLLCGHTHSFDPPIRKIRQIVTSGELGKLCMVNTWNYNEFMYRPRMKHELAMTRGVVLNQGPHHVDIVRLIGGGMVRSVRAMTGIWDKARPWEGSYTCYLNSKMAPRQPWSIAAMGFSIPLNYSIGSAKAASSARRIPILTLEKNSGTCAHQRKKSSSKRTCATAGGAKVSSAMSGAVSASNLFSALPW
jgi:phthalate 4,5-cis-dihydrodiol dehydrogenase